MQGEVVNLNIKAFNKQHGGLIVKCLEIPHYAYSSRWQQLKKQQSDEILIIFCFDNIYFWMSHR